MSDVQLTVTSVDRSTVARQAQDGFAALQAIEIRSDEDRQLVNQSLHWAVTQEKALAAELKECTAPLREAEAKARSWFAPALDALGALQRCLRAKITADAQAQAAANQAKMLSAAEAFKAGQTEQGMQVMSTVAEAPVLVGTSIKMTWVFEVTDPTAVPRALCVPNDALIRAQVKAGAREIPGVRIYQQASTTVRTKKGA